MNAGAKGAAVVSAVGALSKGSLDEKKHFCFIGYRGAGKSTLLRLIKKEFFRRANEGSEKIPKLRFFSLDQVCKKSMGQSIEEAVSKKGWPFFRQVEHEELKRLLSSENPCLIDCGGGVVEDRKNRLLLKKKSWVFFIDTKLELLVSRQLKNPRISLDANNPYGAYGADLAKSIRKETESRLKKRLPWYRECADFTVRGIEAQEKFDEWSSFIFKKFLETVESEKKNPTKHNRTAKHGRR